MGTHKEKAEPRQHTQDRSLQQRTISAQSEEGTTAGRIEIKQPAQCAEWTDTQTPETPHQPGHTDSHSSHCSAKGDMTRTESAPTDGSRH